MNYHLQNCLSDATNIDLNSLSFTGIKHVNRTCNIFYPIIPRDPKYYFDENASLPSERYKNIVYFYYQSHIAKNAESDILVPEEGNTALVFRCSPRKPGVFLVGTPTTPREPEYVIFGCDYFLVYFCAGMGYSFCPFPATEFTDRSFPVDEIFPGKSKSDIKNLAEKIASAATFQERVRTFEQFMETHESLFREIPVHIKYTIDKIRSKVDCVPEGGISNNCWYTDRHIRRMFHKYVGIPPKLYSNIIRHYKARAILCSDPNLDMTYLALELGYYDQSHFIKEFKRFLGFVPSRIIRNLT
ncbi:MAG: AraC family transcriptional regulator [Spirochaetes bacterium]|nr:AraC family transcriptional regulator [Spirochaetota bacterium]